jgi:hypothetical protein
MEVQLYLTNVFSVIFFPAVNLLYAGMIKIINIFLINNVIDIDEFVSLNLTTTRINLKLSYSFAFLAKEFGSDILC